MGVLNFASYLRRNPVLTENFDANDVPANALFLVDLKPWVYNLYRSSKVAADWDTPFRCDYKQLKAEAERFFHSMKEYQLVFVCKTRETRYRSEQPS
jgi:hypothetical protein